MKKVLLITLILVALVSLPSCMNFKKSDSDGYTFTDDLGRRVTISEDDKIAACHASFADCWLLAGGNLVGVTADAVEDHGLDVGDAKIIGSAYALIFWIQNIGLWLFPMLIGKVLDATNPELVEGLKNGVITAEQAAVSYDYTAPLVMLAGLGVAALLLGFALKAVDKKKGLGLEEPNIK